MKWTDITVEQFQAVHKLQKAQMDDFDRLTEIIAVMYGMTAREVDEMSITEYNRLAKGIQFMITDDIPGKVTRYVNIGRKRYFLHTPPDKIKHRQFLEIQHFSQDVIGNLHYLLASICVPVNFRILKGSNNVNHFQDYANDFLQAKIVDVYHACVFFCKVYEASLRSTADYLMRTMEDKEQALEVWTQLNNSADIMAGFSQQNKSPISAG